MAKKEYEIKVKTDEKSLTDTYGKFIIQPLERGYGVTVAVSYTHLRAHET